MVTKQDIEKNDPECRLEELERTVATLQHTLGTLIAWLAGTNTLADVHINELHWMLSDNKGGPEVKDDKEH